MMRNILQKYSEICIHTFYICRSDFVIFQVFFMLNIFYSFFKYLTNKEIEKYCFLTSYIGSLFYHSLPS